MPGALYLSSGPSGAGKDTLLLGAREFFAKEGDASVQFLKRSITRSPELCTDLEVPVSAEEFHAAEASGAFALSWHAHGTWYGIRKADLEGGLAQGLRLVANVSRTVVPLCLERYGSTADSNNSSCDDDNNNSNDSSNDSNSAGQGHEVYCLLITAPNEVLTARLLSRGREADPAEVASRVARATAANPVGDHVLRINNVGSVANGVAACVAALRGQLRYSMWLVPPPLPDPVRAQLYAALKAFGTIDPTGTDVGPHVTLVPGFRATPKNALAALRAVARVLTTDTAAINDNNNDGDGTSASKQNTSFPLESNGNINGNGNQGEGSNKNGRSLALSFPLSARFCGVGTSDTLPFRALVLEVEPSPELLATRVLALDTLSAKPAPPAPFPPTPLLSSSQPLAPPAAAAAALSVPKESAVSTDDVNAVNNASGTPVLFCDETSADAYAPHISLSYGAPLSAQNKALARASFRTFPSFTDLNATTTDKGTTAAAAAAAAATAGAGTVPVEASTAGSDHEAHRTGATTGSSRTGEAYVAKAHVLESLAGLEYGEVALSGLTLVAIEGTEWASWVHVATVDLADGAHSLEERTNMSSQIFF